MLKRNIFYRFPIIGFMIIVGHITSIAQQVSDENFSYPISVPMYKKGRGPLILFDEAHNNASTLKGAYSAFGRLLQQDGYNIVSS